MSITCIIPFFNDSEYLLESLSTLSTVPEISQIILVDDGSTHHHKIKIPENNRIQMVSLTENTGKANAVKSALSSVKNEVVLLIDSDLTHLDARTLSRYMNTYVQRSIDLLILPTTQFFFMNRLSRHNILFAGARILRMSDLKNMFEEESPTGYQIEIAMNRYMLRHHKRAVYGFLKYDPILKSQKVGLVKSIFLNLRMLIHVISYRFPSYLNQVAVFGHTRLDLKEIRQ